MYRVADARGAEDSELVYDVVDRDGRRTPPLALIQAISFPVLAAAICSQAFSPTAGLAALVGTGALGAWWWKRKPRSGLVFRVEAGELLVLFRATGKALVRCRLTDLLNVTLDTKTIQRVVEGSSAIPEMRFVDSRVSAEVDTSRIVLTRRQGASVPLSEAYLAHMDATEWLGKIRVFLRKNGWVPADETDVSEKEEDDDDVVEASGEAPSRSRA